MFTITAHPPNAPPIDLTPLVRALEWQLGTDDPAQAVAPPGRARLTLAAPPESLPQPGWFLTLTRGATVHFSGMMSAVHPLTAPDRAGQAEIEAVTADAGLSETTARLSPLTDCVPGSLIAALLADLPLRRPTLDTVWVLGAPGFGELGAHTPLADPLPLPVEVDPGVSRFAYAALGGLPAAEALRQIVESEGGRCAVSRTGALRFFDRHAPLRPRSIAADLDQTGAGISFERGVRWANCVTSRFHPVRVGTPGSVLWSLAQDLSLPPGTHEMTVHFRDAGLRPTAALALDTLEAGATTGPSGTGSPVSIKARIVEADARSARLAFENPGPAYAWLNSAATRLLGTPLQFGAAVESVHIEPLSTTFHGPRALMLDLPLISDLDEAASRSRFALWSLPEPRMLARQVTLDVRALPSAPALTLGDRIRLRDSATAHDALYDVIGEAHTADAAGTRHRIRLSLAPAPQAAFWTISLQPLDTGTRLAY